MSSTAATPRRRASECTQEDRPTDPQSSKFSNGSAASGEIGRVRHDERGNGVWEWNPELQRRRADDETMDVLKALGIEHLTFEEDKRPEKELLPYERASDAIKDLMKR